MTTMKILLLLLLIVVLSPLRMAAAVKNCPRVPWLGAVAACQKASGTKLIYNLCIRTMRDDGVDMSPSHKEQVTAYAVHAAQDASFSYGDTELAMSNQLDNSSLPHRVRDTYQTCLDDDYPPAEESIDSIADAMDSGCNFAGLADKFMSGMMSLERCRDRLLSLNYSTSVYPMVLVNRQKVSLAFMLAKLLGI